MSRARKGEVLEVATIGNPVLRQQARPLSPDEICSEATAILVADLIATMEALDGIGIAAPQVGESVRLAIIEIPEESSRYPGMPAQGLSIFANPRITVLDETEQFYWEGCLSVPDLRGLVARPRSVRVDYFDLEARPCSLEAEGFLATVIQHEFDHLDGVLFIDRVRDTTKLATIDDYRRFWLDEEDRDETCQP